MNFLLWTSYSILVNLLNGLSSSGKTAHLGKCLPPKTQNPYPQDIEKVRAYKKQWRLDHLDVHQNSMRQMAARKKAMVMAKKIQGCTDCAEKDPIVIQLHAPNGHSKKRACIGDGSRFTYAALAKEIALCVPLCANCHLRRHYEATRTALQTDQAAQTI